MSFIMCLDLTFYMFLVLARPCCVVCHCYVGLVSSVLSLHCCCNIDDEDNDSCVHTECCCVDLLAGC